MFLPRFYCFFHSRFTHGCSYLHLTFCSTRKRNLRSLYDTEMNSSQAETVDKSFAGMLLGESRSGSLKLSNTSGVTSTREGKLDGRSVPASEQAALADNEPTGDWEKRIDFEDVKLLAKFISQYNFIRVLEVARQADHPVAGSRVLLLDRPGNIHSIYSPYRVMTNSYYDVFATLPPLLPDGPLAILGLGAGTAARLLLHFWPRLEIHGWEIDSAVIDLARKYFNLSDLEEGTTFSSNRSRNSAEGHVRERKDSRHSNGFLRSEDKNGKQGRLVVHIGDALSSVAMLHGRFAGIFVDLFAAGAVISPLQNPETWQNIKSGLIEAGRIMVNCGGSCIEAERPGKDGCITMNKTLNAMTKIFPGQVWKNDMGKHGDSTVALTGPMPDLSGWREVLPDSLRNAVLKWTAPV